LHLPRTLQVRTMKRVIFQEARTYSEWWADKDLLAVGECCKEQQQTTLLAAWNLLLVGCSRRCSTSCNLPALNQCQSTAA